MRREFSAGVIIYYQRKESDPRSYLLLKYPSGYWDLAKGKIEEGETKEQTALREVKEETGLDVTIIPGFAETLHYFFNSRKDRNGKPVTPENELVSKEVTFFVGIAKSKHVTISDEHRDYAWLNSEDAYDQLTFKNARDVFTKALEFLKEIENP